MINLLELFMNHNSPDVSILLTIGDNVNSIIYIDYNLMSQFARSSHQHGDSTIHVSHRTDYRITRFTEELVFKCTVVISKSAI